MLRQMGIVASGQGRKIRHLLSACSDPGTGLLSALQRLFHLILSPALEGLKYMSLLQPLV